MVGVDLESVLKQQVEKVKQLVGTLPLSSEQKTELLRYIHQRDFLVADMPLDPKNRENLNKNIKKMYGDYNSAMQCAASYPAVSEWMREPTEVVGEIWDNLIKN